LRPAAYRVLFRFFGSAEAAAGGPCSFFEHFGTHGPEEFQPDREASRPADLRRPEMGLPELEENQGADRQRHVGEPAAAFAGQVLEVDDAKRLALAHDDLVTADVAAHFAPPLDGAGSFIRPKADGRSDVVRPIQQLHTPDSLSLYTRLATRPWNAERTAPYVPMTQGS